MRCSDRSGRLVCRAPIKMRLRTIWLLPILLLAACSQAGYGPGGRSRVEIGADGWRAPTRYYPPPGPPDDPWGPYTREAAARYRVPEQWIRAVMHQESGGQEQAVSSAGAMGLMQVMPSTYEELRVRHGLGDDPYDPHNNVLAGTAYIREMYDRYGSPGFLAAYNAGPDRVDDYLAGRGSLPDETVNYLAAITPNLGGSVPRSGPFAVYASARSGRGSRYAPTIASLAAGCDLNAAYNPDHPCTTLERAATQAAPIQTASAAQLGANGCDLNAAFDPNHPCTAAGQSAALSTATRRPSVQPRSPPVLLASAADCDPDAAYNPNRPCSAAASLGSRPRTATAHSIPTEIPASLHEPTPRPKPIPPATRAGPSSFAAASPTGSWGIQIGAFKSPSLARAVAEGARAEAPAQLRSATLELPPTAPFGNTVLYRARLVHLSESAASAACTRLNHHQLPCVVVRPSGS
jgi:D-alanyl-D-alanine carboxypeptidase